MKATHYLYAVLYLFLFFIAAACSDDEIKPNETGKLVLEFDNRVGEDNLQLETDYANASGEVFRLTKLNYYISNIRLRTITGKEYAVPQDSSYFLVMEDVKESQSVELRNIPAGDYNEITFTIGVDSLRSTMDVSRRTGVLDPAQGHDGMYWTWNSGYIFFKMEGISPAAPADQENKFYYHIGGYGGYASSSINNIREKTITIGQGRAEVRGNRSPQVHLHVDVLEFFTAPASVSIAGHSLVMFSEYSTTISAHYVNMFRYDHVHN